jgi:hypothetical protein
MRISGLSLLLTFYFSLVFLKGEYKLNTNKKHSEDYQQLLKLLNRGRRKSESQMREAGWMELAQDHSCRLARWVWNGSPVVF